MKTLDYVIACLIVGAFALTVNPARAASDDGGVCQPETDVTCHGPRIRFRG